MTWILHISDLHIGYPGTLDRFRRMVRGLSTNPQLEPEKTVVVITGDLVNRISSRKDFKIVKGELKALALAGYQKILVIPGNHDYGSGSRGSKQYVSIFKDVFYGKERTYPILDIVEDIAFIGLDSMAEELNWYDRQWAEGEIGTSQLERFRTILQMEEVRQCGRRVIYLHHHPFDWQPLHQLKDSLQLGEIIESTMGEGTSIDAILYGHHHRGRSSNGHWGVKRCYDAGTATLKPRQKVQKMLPWFWEVQNATRLFDLDKPTSEDRLITIKPESVGEPTRGL
ncbi:MAG TPA: metallophosphoesterase [Methanomassiliicoccales archaeon]|nr:metallophosphoesterase [Methanomassiliicoccales archaeon]